MKKSLFILALLLSATFFSAYAKKESVCSALQGKNISILGDSYSTFIGWIPQGYAVWYNPTSNKTDVHQVEDTWWWQLCDKTDCTLLVNSSYSGSTIGNTGYKGADATHSSFITRMKKDMGQERMLQAKPQIIFVFGGTNDCWANAPLGKPQYDNWSTDDLYQTFPASCYMFHYLKKWNPGCRIVFLSNSELKEEFYTGMKEICNYYQVEYLPLKDIGKQSRHPNIEGMKSICNQIIRFLNRK